MDEIAAGAGVTKGSLYWHYSSKKEIVLASCDQYYGRWRAEITAARAEGGGPLGELTAAVNYSVRSCLLDGPNRIFTTEIVAMALYDEDVRASWAGFLQEVERLFLGLAHRAVGAGELDSDDVDRSVDFMIAAMEGIKQVALFHGWQGRGNVQERLAGQLMGLLGAARP